MQGSSRHLEHRIVGHDGRICIPLQSLPGPLPSAALLLDWNAAVVPRHSSRKLEIQAIVITMKLHCEARACRNGGADASCECSGSLPRPRMGLSKGIDSSPKPQTLQIGFRHEQDTGPHDHAQADSHSSSVQN